MVLSLRLNVLQHGMELTRAYRKRAVATLPEKAAIPSIKRFDPFRGCFLYLFDELRLGDSSWQRRDNVNVIANTTHTQNFATEMAADRRQIGVHARLYGGIEPWLAILCTKNNVNDDFAERLRHGVNNEPKRPRNESRFQRWVGVALISGAMPQAVLRSRLWR